MNEGKVMLTLCIENDISSYRVAAQEIISAFRGQRSTYVIVTALKDSNTLDIVPVTNGEEK